MVEQFVVVHSHDFAVGIDLQRSQFLQSCGEVPVAVRVVVFPTATTTSTTTVRVVLNPGEREDVAFEHLINLPLRIVRAIGLLAAPLLSDGQ